VVLECRCLIGKRKEFLMKRFLGLYLLCICNSGHSDSDIYFYFHLLFLWLWIKLVFNKTSAQLLSLHTMPAHFVVFGFFK
jgi:hypothetical protein